MEGEKQNIWGMFPEVPHHSVGPFGLFVDTLSVLHAVWCARPINSPQDLTPKVLTSWFDLTRFCVLKGWYFCPSSNVKLVSLILLE